MTATLIDKDFNTVRDGVEIIINVPYPHPPGIISWKGCYYVQTTLTAPQFTIIYQETTIYEIV